MCVCLCVCVYTLPLSFVRLLWLSLFRRPFLSPLPSLTDTSAYSDVFFFSLFFFLRSDDDDDDEGGEREFNIEGERESKVVASGRIH